MALTTASAAAEVAIEFERSDPQCWQYFAQGAVNVMFRYVTAESCELSRYLLRIPKLLSQHGVGAAEDSPNDEEQKRFRKRFFDLCGTHYMPSHVDVRIGPAYLGALPDVGCKLNPCGSACLVQNVSAAPGGLTIEIKPKCGIVPSRSNLSDEHACKSKTCRFCMYQFTKLSRGKVARTSSYCPIQFFRGDHEATVLSLQSLLDCPQNNIKISNSDGLLLGCDVSDQSLLTRALISGGLSIDHLVHLIAQSLLLSNVLQDIKRVQELDSLGIELLWKRYCQSRESPDVLNLVDNFMLSTCAKDVSVIIALEPSAAPASAGFNPLPQSALAYRARIIDVDQRPRAWLQKYYKQDLDIVSEFLASGCARKCVE
jgi:hypothetical protein